MANGLQARSNGEIALLTNRLPGMLLHQCAAIRLLFLALVCAGLSAEQVPAQSLSQVPARTLEAVNALQENAWRQLAQGLDVLEVSTALGTRLTALRIDNSRYRFDVVQQQEESGERARSVVRRLDAVLAVNGGFFASSASGRLRPVGMLIDDGERLSSAWPQSGGFLAFNRDGQPSMSLSQAGPPEDTFEAIQSRPVILEQGGKWAMNTNGNDPERRTIFCQLDRENSLILVVSGQGLSLYEAGWLLRSPSWGGYFDCDWAIALDGGSSTQLTIANEWDLRVDALLGVQNFLVVQGRNPKTQ